MAGVGVVVAGTLNGVLSDDKGNYSNPFILERADPYVVKGPDGFYYFTASSESVSWSYVIADEYAEKYPSIVKAVHKPNGGHGSAVNAGIANATGLFFKVVHSDDWVKEEAYDAILDKLRELVKSGQMIDMFISNFVYEKEEAEALFQKLSNDFIKANPEWKVLVKMVLC